MHRRKLSAVLLDVKNFLTKMIKIKVIAQGVMPTNCIVVQNGTQCVVVDVPYGSEDVAKYINANGLTIQAVLLTHGHFDHCGGVHRLLKQCNAEDVPVYVSPKDAELCRHAADNIWHVHCDNCFTTNELTEGELLIGGTRFFVIETPGHTCGSVVFLVEDYMLSGDTLFARGVGRTDFAESNPYLMKGSLNKLKLLPRNYIVLPGHGGQTTLQFEKDNNPYLK